MNDRVRRNEVDRRRRSSRVRIAGSGTSAMKTELATPIVSTRPNVYSPRCAASNMLPKPTIVVVDVSTSELMMLGEMR